MNGTTALHDTIALLRSVEAYCYEVAHYLLGNEQAAALACEQALLALSCNPKFIHAGLQERLSLTKSTAISCALLSARNHHPSNTTKEPTPAS